MTLAELELLPASDVADLVAAYEYLRRVENGLQLMRDQQVHQLPIDEADRWRLCAIMAVEDWASFRTELGRHQQAVERCFGHLFADRAAPQSMVTAVVDGQPAVDTCVLEQARIDVDDELLERLNQLLIGAFHQRLTARAQECVEHLVPQLIDHVSRLVDDPGQRRFVLIRCLSFTRAVAGRSGYLQALIEQPSALQRLVALFARSAWLAGFVERHPVVIDELLHPGELPANPGDFAVAVNEGAQGLQDAPLEDQMNTMRQLQQSLEFRITLAELDGRLPLMQVSDALSWLAEAIFSASLQLVRNALVARHGEPVAEGRALGMAVLAYGKLGGLELGHGSDLDLVFLHDGPAQGGMTQGNVPIDATVFHARLAQKLVHFMTTRMPSGVLYEVDLRLRPNGQSGVLVSSFEAFEHYQSDAAWTWEHQALVRTRMIWGSDAMRQRFTALRRQVLTRLRDPDQLKREVVEMRDKMRRHLGSHGSNQVHLKQDRGGVADVEFMVQYLILRHAHAVPELVTCSDNIRQLEAIVKAGVLDEKDATTLTQAYLVLRSRLHQQALQLAGSQLDAEVADGDTELQRVRQSVAELWQSMMGASQ